MYSYIVLALCERPICHNSISATGSLFSVAESRTPDPLNKNQFRADQNRTLTRKPNHFENRLPFSSTMEGVCSAQVQAQTSRVEDARRKDRPSICRQPLPILISTWPREVEEVFAKHGGIVEAAAIESRTLFPARQ